MTEPLFDGREVVRPSDTEEGCDTGGSLCTCGWPDQADCQGGGFPCPANPRGHE